MLTPGFRIFLHPGLECARHIPNRGVCLRGGLRGMDGGVEGGSPLYSSARRKLLAKAYASPGSHSRAHLFFFFLLFLVVIFVLLVSYFPPQLQAHFLLILSSPQSHHTRYVTLINSETTTLTPHNIRVVDIQYLVIRLTVFNLVSVFFDSETNPFLFSR